MTDIIPNQNMPGGVMKQLGDAAGGVTYDQYAPGGCVGQLYEAAGVAEPLDQYAEGGPLGQIEQELEGGGGGGGVPDWVPADAVIHIDLVGGDPQGRAWVAGGGVVAVDTLLGSDPNTDQAWSVTSYDPEKLTVDGYVGGTNSPTALIGAALVLMVAGGTLRVQFKDVPGAADGIAIAFVAADGSDAIDLALHQLEEGLVVSSWSGSLSENIASCMNTGTGVLNGIAFTLVTDRIDAAVNGFAAVTSPVDETDRPPGNPLVAWLFEAANHAVQSITLYDPLPSTAGLSDLSEVA